MHNEEFFIYFYIRTHNHKQQLNFLKLKASLVTPLPPSPNPNPPILFHSDLLLLNHFPAYLGEDQAIPPGQPRDLIFPASPDHFPEPPQLTPFNVEEQQLYSEPLSNDWTHALSKRRGQPPFKKG